MVPVLDIFSTDVYRPVSSSPSKAGEAIICLRFSLAMLMKPNLVIFLWVLRTEVYRQYIVD